MRRGPRSWQKFSTERMLALDTEIRRLSEFFRIEPAGIDPKIDFG